MLRSFVHRMTDPFNITCEHYEINCLTKQYITDSLTY